jgi:hypothetical protein
MKAKSIKGKSVAELTSALAETITAAFRPTYALHPPPPFRIHLITCRATLKEG